TRSVRIRPRTGEVTNPMTLTSRKAATLTSALTVGALALAGCSGPAGGPAAEHAGHGQSEAVAEQPQEPHAFTRDDLGGPSEEHFGEIAWATEIDEADIGFVRGDRMIATRTVDMTADGRQREFLALDASGQEAWSAEYEEG